MQVLKHPVPRGAIAYKNGKQDLRLHEADGKKHHRELQTIKDYGGRVVLTERRCVCAEPKSPASPETSLLFACHEHSGFAVPAQRAPHTAESKEANWVS